MENLSITIVLYNNDLNTVNQTIKSCIQDLLPKHIYVIDNSDDLKLSVIETLYKINYLKNINKGFGSGHNFAFKKFNILRNYKYNIILNPDITFEKDTVKRLMKYLDQNPKVGALMPKIVNTDGTLQFARRCLPKPSHLIQKRLFPNSKLANEYELKCYEPKVPIELIGICGCFMLINLDIIKRIGLFDERYFMYFEDFDLARRISLNAKVIYYPLVRVFHEAQRGHKTDLKLFFHLIISSIKYFYKWGIFDNYREETNRKLIEKIKKI